MINEKLNLILSEIQTVLQKIDNEEVEQMKNEICSARKIVVCGAGPVFNSTGEVVGGFKGTDVVQTHMTNSRLTDPEVLEFRFPVRLLSYSLREGSGGLGKFAGGVGGIRRIEFLEPMTAGILSNGRIYPRIWLGRWVGWLARREPCRQGQW